MTYTYKNLEFNAAADKNHNTHQVTVEGVQKEQLGLITNGKGSEGSLTSVWGHTQDGKKVAFYISEKFGKAVKQGETYDFTLSANRLEPWDYQDASAERRTFGVAKSAPVPKR